MPIAEFLVGSLDERGYLATTVEAVAEAFRTDDARVLRILKELQQVAPAGVGARDLRECLLIQLDSLDEPGEEVPQVREILENHFEALGSHKYTYIAQQMGISTDEVNQARDFIKKNLNPFPAEGQVGELNGVRYAGSRPGHVLPDVIISERDGEFQIEVIESRRYFLKLNPLYLSLSNKLAKTNEDTSEEEREHIRHYVNRAKTFLSNINQRRETMLRITQALVDIQQDFLRNGVRDLRPLTRSTLASYLGLHESTVSRATAGKYVMLPNRKVIPFSDFFTASLSIKDVIKEIIEKEKNKDAERLTDQVIVEKLADQGIHVARRTVAKYRAQLKILPSTLR
jgi:RNA polymerase sigma-54 factor